MLKSNIWQKVLNLYQTQLFNIKTHKNSDIVIMLVPGESVISGGILSIYSFYYATKRLLMNTSVIICTFPNEKSSLKYKWFKNSVNLISFNIAINKLAKFKKVLINIPEYYVGEFIERIDSSQQNRLRAIEDLHINVMNQNNELMPISTIFEKLKTFTSNITITTAHSKYTTKQMRDEYNVPVHLLSAWFEQKEIEPKFYQEKEDIIIISPDEHPLKVEILEKIKTDLPHLKQIIIKNIKYDDFKELEYKAKWSISFGEGFDGYTIFPVLKGGISFAVYNETFFEEKYKKYNNFYSTYDMLKFKITSDIIRLDRDFTYNNYNRILRKQMEEEYSYNKYLNRVSEFYNCLYTLP